MSNMTDSYLQQVEGWAGGCLVGALGAGGSQVVGS